MSVDTNSHNVKNSPDVRNGIQWMDKKRRNFLHLRVVKLGPFASMSGAEYFTPPSHEDVPKVIRFSMRH